MTNRHQPQRRRMTAALVIAASLAALAAVMLWDSARLADMGGYSGVGPATVPRVIAFFLPVLAAWTIIVAARGGFPEAPQQNVPPVLFVVAGLAAQMLLLKVAGFSLATGILFALTALAFGKRNLALTLPLGIVLAFAVWTVFSQLLMLHLPAGPLEHLFFPGG